ncbi:hypothetical protein KCU73_g752, partial [Aureobasidium melanogenum]
LARLKAGEAAEHQRLLEACQSHGFFALDIHESGVEIDYASLLRFMKTYFAQPLATKMADARFSDTHGYEPVGTSAGVNDGEVDGYESLKVSRAELLVCAHKLPTQVREDFGLIKTSMTSMHIACMDVVSALAAKLGAASNESIRASHTDEVPSTTTLSMFRYPGSTDHTEAHGHNQHTDLGSLTMLFSTDWGLQIRTPGSRDWAYVVPNPKRVIINVGDSLRFLSGNRLLSTQEFLERYEDFYPDSSFWVQELPGFTTILSYLGISPLGSRYYHARSWLEKWILDMCSRADEILERRSYGLETPTADQPTVYEQVKSAVEKDCPNLDATAKRLLVASELWDQLSGAREVLGLVMGYSFHYIAGSPDSQNSMRAEFHSVDTFTTPITLQTKDSKPSQFSVNLPADWSSLNVLRYLTSTPADRSVSLAGVDGIPPGTRVNTFQWLFHRSPKTWPAADDWLPERWLKAESQDHVLWPFVGPGGVWANT